MKNLSPLHAESRVSWLAHTASACLIDEARLSPKPGLVDSRGNGAHQDLNLALMERSARSLQPTFHALAEQSWRRPTASRRKALVKGFAPAAAGRCQAPARKRSVVSRISPAWRCRNYSTAGREAPVSRRRSLMR